MGPSRLAAVGVFLIAGVLLFGVGLFLIGDRRMLFSDTVRVHAEFATIAGLENGAVVRVAGMTAGEVEQIQVPPGPADRFRVRMRVRSELRPLLRTDSVASIQNDGLVGNKFVQVEPGTPDAPPVEDGGTIASREPFDITNLLEKMSDTVDTVNATITVLKSDIEEALEAVTVTAQSARELITDIGQDAREVVSSTEQVASDLEEIVSGIRSGRGSVGKLLTDDALYERARGIATEAEQTVANLRRASDEARAALADLRGENGAVQGLTGTLAQTLAYARDAMADLAENTEALKRSFFFRGYFNRRGYFDLDDVSVEDYRKGALESADRRPLRIWIGAEFLFERTDEGTERLTADGRSRIDSVMSQFLKYPRTSPLIIEGYADGTTADQRFLASRRRGRLVRDYVLARFELSPEVVAVMPMGREATGAPRGDGWDGVALALFVGP
ncbi:MAG TPA: MlaD family protein [Vicinamibacterales bacterium]|nr:MlaD family protein [Vicinamibacterales bacterium]